MRAVTEADVCEGNSDERFLALPSIQKNTMKDNSSMLLYVTLNIVSSVSGPCHHCVILCYHKLVLTSIILNYIIRVNVRDKIVY